MKRGKLSHEAGKKRDRAVEAETLQAIHEVQEGQRKGKVAPETDPVPRRGQTRGFGQGCLFFFCPCCIFLLFTFLFSILFVHFIFIALS